MSWAVAASLLGHSRLAVERHYARRAKALNSFGAEAAEHRLRLALANAELHLRAVEVEAWRDYHGATVASASSLALAWLEHERLNIDEVVSGLGPDGDEPRWLVGGAAAGGVRHAWHKGVAAPRNLHADGQRARFLHSGLLLRRWGDPKGALGVRLSDHGLELAVRFPGVSLRTAGDVAVVVVEADVPDTMRIAMISRPLRDLVDHPALRDPNLLVGEVDGPGRARSLVPEAWRMVVRVPRVPWRLPWARGRA